jgi:glycosyltransferase involved in cell wall biosynthesis
MQVDTATKFGGQRCKGGIAQGSPDQPLVTVITAVFNGQPYVRGCLESVLRQDYPNLEHIVLDAGSSDGTVDVLRQYDDRIALWKSEGDKGIFEAWNKALLEARGEWICFLGSDDEFLPGAVSAFMQLAAENPQAEYLCSKAKLLFPSSGKVRIDGHPWTWRGYSRRVWTVHQGSMHRKSLFERLGNFDDTYRIASDYEFLLRQRSELRSAFTPAVTVLVRAGGASYSQKVIYEIHRAKMENGGIPKLHAYLDLAYYLIMSKAISLKHRIFDRRRSDVGPEVIQ